MTFNPYAEGALIEERHAPIVKRLDFFAKDAGIQPHWIAKPSKPFLIKPEIDYLIDYRKMALQGVHGLCLVRSSSDADPNTHMAALAAALVRNFIRARVFTLGQVLDDVAASGPPQADCLLIPNFFEDSLAKWRVGALYDLMMQRQFEGNQTIVFVPGMAALKSSYGEELTRFVKTYYHTVAI
jgi:hypothetical protein